MTLKAAARNLIDFSKSNVRDHGWWLKWRYLIRSLNQEETEELLGRLYDLRLSLISNPKLNIESQHKETLKLYHTIKSLKQPWAEELEKQYQQSESDQFALQWEKLTGWNPKDKQAVEKWSEEVRNATRGKQEEREKQAQEEQARLDNFHATAEAVRKKRLKQQGRY